MEYLNCTAVTKTANVISIIYASTMLDYISEEHIKEDCLVLFDKFPVFFSTVNKFDISHIMDWSKDPIYIDGIESHFNNELELFVDGKQITE